MTQKQEQMIVIKLQTLDVIDSIDQGKYVFPNDPSVAFASFAERDRHYINKELRSMHKKLKKLK